MALLQSLFNMATGNETPVPNAPTSSTYWGRDPEWLKLSPTERAAAMALLEADSSNGRIDLGSARNALGAMINRADKEGVDLGEHVSGKIYQPTIEPAQRARLNKIIGSPEHQEMVALANRRLAGDEADWVNGATHFLAPEKTMLALEAREPNKYKNWGPRGQNWTKFGEDPERPNEYKGVVMRDASHAFLAPEGAHSAQFGKRSPYEGIDTGGATAPAASPVAVASAQSRPTAGTMAPQASGSAPETAPVNDSAAVLDLMRQAQKAQEQNNLAASAAQQASAGGEQIRYAKPQAPDIQKLLSLLKNRQTLGTIRRA
jgi:hypothetical protein